jgi:hypothetical protein
MDETTQPSPEGRLDPVARPPGQLHDYPVPVRWEVTRRHPYYLVFWKDALRYRRNRPGDHPAQVLLDHAAALILGSIGVTGEPVSPETRFEDLIGGDNDPAFLAGTVQPVTFRAVVAMLINGLSPAERGDIAYLSCAPGGPVFANEPVRSGLRPRILANGS